MILKFHAHLFEEESPVPNHNWLAKYLEETFTYKTAIYSFPWPSSACDQRFVSLHWLNDNRVKELPKMY